METDGPDRCCRCGACCANVGTIWLWSDHPIVAAFRELLAAEPGARASVLRDTGPCAMLARENGQAVCLLRKHLGRAAQPQVCRDYPFPGERCLRKESL